MTHGCLKLVAPQISLEVLRRSLAMRYSFDREFELSPLDRPTHGLLLKCQIVL